MNKSFWRKPVLGSEPALPSAGSELPYLPQPKQARLNVRENGRVLLVGGGLVIVLLMLAFSGVSHRQPARQTSQKSGSVAPASENKHEEISLTPILDIAPSAAEITTSSVTSADQILRTTKEKPRPSHSLTLASVPRIEDTSWQPPPYSPQLHSEPPPIRDKIRSTEQDGTPTVEQNSLVFVAKAGPASQPSAGQPAASENRSFHLNSGTRLRARLESEINSAVKTPVVAVLEENYEQDGLILIPAGSRAIGRLINADKSGYVEVQFDSLDLPSGSSLQWEATATDLQLRPLRGRVQGKGTGRNLLVRSAAGIGQIAATLVGRGSLNQPLSEEDMLRERLSNNIGQAGDQQVAAMALSQRFVVSLAAGVEVYLIVEKASDQRTDVKDSPAGTIDQHDIDELRQLLQLQRELRVPSAAQ